MVENNSFLVRKLSAENCMTSSVNLGHFHFHWEKRVEQAGGSDIARDWRGVREQEKKKRKVHWSSLLFVVIIAVFIVVVATSLISHSCSGSYIFCLILLFFFLCCIWHANYAATATAAATIRRTLLKYFQYVNLCVIFTASKCNAVIITLFCGQVYMLMGMMKVAVVCSQRILLKVSTEYSQNVL